MVIYTSGTTGLPKGINNNHMKLCAIGIGVSANLGLGQDDVGYACMPLFHSNAMFVGFMPAFWVGGAMGMRERFSASQFVPDVLRYGVTFWNYVGEPVHYVLAAIEKQYGGDEARIARRDHQQPEEPASATPSATARRRPTSTASCDWLGLEDMFELYGSTEAAISTFRRKGDPRGSVGEMHDAAVKILDEQRQGVPAGRARRRRQAAQLRAGRRRDLPRRRRHRPLPGLLRQPRRRTPSKYRDGVYHSGDLGHMLDARRPPLPLLRRPHRRLDPQGRRELLRRPGRRASLASTPTSRSPSPTACRARSPTSW